MTTPNDATAIREQWMKSNQIDEDTGGYLHAHYSDVDQLIVSLLQEASASTPTGGWPSEGELKAIAGKFCNEGLIYLGHHVVGKIADSLSSETLYLSGFKEAHKYHLAETARLRECLAIATEAINAFHRFIDATNGVNACDAGLAKKAAEYSLRQAITRIEQLGGDI